MTLALHDRAMQLLCFGGPLNEQIIDVPPGEDTVRAALPDRRPLIEQSFDDPIGPSHREGRYTVEKVGYHGWVARCLVYDGYPKQRITNALNALVGMSNLWTWLV